MQKNNKFLVITIWIATISFIFTGATYGFSFGLKSSSIGKTGDIELSRDVFNMEYRTLYNRYNQIFQGKFDQAKAKEMKLEDQVINSMVVKALILNLAKDFGIVVSDEELAQHIANIPAFQNNGVFDKSIYKNFLQMNGLKLQTFEKSLRDDLVVQKTLSLLSLDSLKEEVEALYVTFELADKIKYKVISQKDINISIAENDLKKFWEDKKELFKNPTKFTFDIVWLDTKEINVTDDEVRKFYKENSFRYTSNDGKILTFEEAKEKVTQDLRLKRAKRDANKKYIAFKKGDIKKDETLSFSIDNNLSKEIWEDIKNRNIGDILKPKAVDNRYAIIKIIDIVEPTVMSFNDAKTLVEPLYKEDLIRDKLAKLSDNMLKNIDNIEINVSKFITLSNIEKQDLLLNQQEKIDFASKLFTSNQEKGIISIKDKIVIYKILEQKLVIDNNKSDINGFKLTVNKLKKEVFESNLIKELNIKYPTKIYE
jgi:peptidyl-prolyl cis-trans isomerase D